MKVKSPEPRLCFLRLIKNRTRAKKESHNGNH
jgi:hypothetical protein